VATTKLNPSHDFGGLETVANTGAATPAVSHNAVMAHMSGVSEEGGWPQRAFVGLISWPAVQVTPRRAP
jgi:hypothetical protein